MKTDKLLHFLLGIIISVFGCIITFVLGYKFPELVGVLLGIIAGATKEIYDYKTLKGTPEIADFVATSFGAFIAAFAFHFLIQLDVNGNLPNLI